MKIGGKGCKADKTFADLSGLARGDLGTNAFD